MWQYNNTPSSELYHWGIKGQKWGVRRFQNEDGSLTPEGKRRYGIDDTGVISDRSQKKIDRDAKRYRRQINLENKYREQGLSQEEAEQKADKREKVRKAVIIGSAAVATALVAYGGYKIYQSNKADIDPLTGFRKLKNPAETMDAVNRANPGRVRFFSKDKNIELINGSSMNCALCTTSIELQKRGYDVKAGLSKTGFKMDKIEEFYKNGKFDQTSKLAFTDMMKHGNGARGNICVFWETGGGHSMYWENIDGVTRYFDGQTGVEYKNFKSEILSYTHSAIPISTMRTDNLELNTDVLKKLMNNESNLKTYAKHGAEVVANAANSPIGTLAKATALGTAATVATAGAVKTALDDRNKTTKLNNRNKKSVKRGSN